MQHYNIIYIIPINIQDKSNNIDIYIIYFIYIYTVLVKIY